MDWKKSGGNSVAQLYIYIYIYNNHYIRCEASKRCGSSNKRVKIRREGEIRILYIYRCHTEAVEREKVRGVFVWREPEISVIVR